MGEAGWAEEGLVVQGSAEEDWEGQEVWAAGAGWGLAGVGGSGSEVEAGSGSVAEVQGLAASAVAGEGSEAAADLG